MIKQNTEVGKTLALLVHQSMNWNNPMNMDDIDEIVNIFKKELMELNGED